MLITTKKTTTMVTVNITGTSTIDDDNIARFNAHLSPDENPTVIMTILDENKFNEEQDSVFEDEKMFEDYVCRTGRAATTSVDEETMVFGDNEEKMQK